LLVGQAENMAERGAKGGLNVKKSFKTMGGTGMFKPTRMNNKKRNWTSCGRRKGMAEVMMGTGDQWGEGRGEVGRGKFAKQVQTSQQ